MERSKEEMVSRLGEMGRLQPGYQGPEALGTQELVVSLRLYDQSLSRARPDLGHGGPAERHARRVILQSGFRICFTCRSRWTV